MFRHCFYEFWITDTEPWFGQVHAVNFRDENSKKGELSGGFRSEALTLPVTTPRHQTTWSGRNGHGSAATVVTLPGCGRSRYLVWTSAAFEAAKA